MRIVHTTEPSYTDGFFHEPYASKPNVETNTTAVKIYSNLTNVPKVGRNFVCSVQTQTRRIVVQKIMTSVYTYV